MAKAREKVENASNIHNEIINIAVPEMIKAAIDQISDPFVFVFLESLQKINEVYLVGTLPFIQESHPERFEKLQAIKQELNRQWGIKIAFYRKWTKAGGRNNLDRFRNSVLGWYQWFFHSFYLFINQEGPSEEKEEEIEEEILEQEDAEEEIEDDDAWIDRMYQKSLDDLQCFLDCEHYGTWECREHCPQEPA